MDLKLRGKRALITGSSAGLGEAIARLMAAEGAEVIVHGRNKERTASVAKAFMMPVDKPFMFWATCRQTKARTP
jgi:NAD(P)-dependent dehydrogenase (short-subunit alcohol dehydrogenase family)